MSELSKAYEPQKYEDEMYKQWEQAHFFSPETSAVTQTEASFSIVLPPPNVTGTLHMGHAAMLAIEDMMVRYKRMQGKRTLWVPGTDHAAIATQSKVEKLILETEKKTKYDLGREEFLRRVQDFAQKSHDTIISQCKKMGASLDWNREAYTLDEVRSRAVRLVFKHMYDDSLIYQGYRIVNWDPQGQTTVSDDEVIYKEEKTKFYYFKYGPFVIGTARPETKFGDKYIVVHPDDARYADFHSGQRIELEWINGPITATVIKDAAIDQTFGTGAMTITPWHSAIDFEIAERHGLDKEQVIDDQGKLLAIAGEFAGMPIATARQKIVDKLRAKGLLVKEEDYVHQIATAERSGGLIEPHIKKQWFVAVNKEFTVRTGVFAGQKVTLKQLMQRTVQDGSIKILPDRFEKTYFSWIDNLRDWCISRQIWFGHRIPVWYCASGMPAKQRDALGYTCGAPIVSATEPPSCPACHGLLTQDPDTLDTWFSSGLWTFSTLLNPEIQADETLAAWVARSPDIEKFHPTSVLETGYDIIFFWVARMILMTTYALGTVPFRTVYLHGLVRDEQGRKMSKSLGNIINPLDMINEYGTDATRLSLLVGSTPGNDTKLSVEKVAGFRNFTNKLWNIARFALLHIGNTPPSGRVPTATTLSDAWILFHLNATVQQVTAQIEAFNFSYAGEVLRNFTWNYLADWYLEIAKIEGKKQEILSYVLETVLKLWHPFMPFVTEAIWQEWRGKSKSMLVVAPWPREFLPRGEYFAEAAQFHLLVEVPVTAIRIARQKRGLLPQQKITVHIGAGSQVTLLKEQQRIISELRTNIKELVIEEKIDKKATFSLISFIESIEIYLDEAGAVDHEKEKAHITKELAETERYEITLTQKLANQAFVAHAPAAIIAAEQAKRIAAQEKVSALRERLAMLAGTK